MPQTSEVVQPKYKHANLMLHDWITVVAYHDSSQFHSKKWSGTFPTSRMVHFYLIKQHSPTICQLRVTHVIKNTLMPTQQHSLGGGFEL